jgi:hypothetical protein
VRISIEINDVHLAALDALAERYAVGRNQLVALLVTAAVKREEAADAIRAVEADRLELKPH